MHRLGRLEDGVIGLCRRELQTCADIFGFEIGEVLKDFGFGYAGGKKLKDINDPDAHAADTGTSAALLGVERDSIEVAHERKLSDYDLKVTLITSSVPNFPSFPNSIWERDCQRNSVAAFSHRAKGSAMELPQQARSQTLWERGGNLGTPLVSREIPFRAKWVAVAPPCDGPAQGLCRLPKITSCTHSWARTTSCPGHPTKPVPRAGGVLI